MVQNGLSVDVDEFVSAFTDANDINLTSSYKNNISDEVDLVLKLLKDIGISATFFINGKSVAAFPDVIKQIADAGHEIGCHGYSHKFIKQYKTQQEFEDDLEQCLDLIYTHTKVRPIGYRAPGCTLLCNRGMVLNVLKKYSFVYDSSITTFGFAKQHGCRKTPLYPFKWNNGIIEFPPSSTELKCFRIPAFGTYFLRLFPTFLTDMAISSLNRKEKNAFFYFHAFELFRNKYPREIMNIDFPLVYIYTLFSGNAFKKKLSYILKRHEFKPYKELLNHFSNMPAAENQIFK